MRCWYNRDYEYVTNYILKKDREFKAIEDIYNDTLIIFIAKVRAGKFKLGKASISTFLCNVAFLLWRNRRRADNKHLPDISLSEIKDSELKLALFEEIDFDILEPPNPRQLKVIAVFGKLKEECQKLLNLAHGLPFFFGYPFSMQEIAEMMGYTNAKHAGTRKSRCMNALRELLNLK